MKGREVYIKKCYLMVQWENGENRKRSEQGIAIRKKTRRYLMGQREEGNDARKSCVEEERGEKKSDFIRKKVWEGDNSTREREMQGIVVTTVKEREEIYRRRKDRRRGYGRVTKNVETEGGGKEDWEGEREMQSGEVIRATSYGIGKG